ncbi:MAG: glycosyltransferase family A protein [Algoriphagus sp.]|nr:glycosyltransferase family A protein [Algoriphagus sp.]
MALSKPLISIVIPCFNQAKYLEETVKSALSSKYQPKEIIIVNDGSTDSSIEIAKGLEESHPEILLINQENSGVSRARNNGISHAKGKYILPLDGDDLISENYVPDAIQILENQSEVKVVYCEAVKFDEKGQKIWNLKPFSRNALARDNMIFVAGVYRKSDWKACDGYSEDMKMGREDWEFWIKMLKNGGEVVKLPYVGFFYRMTPGSKRKKTGTTQKKRERIAYLNAKHGDFFERELNGPLRFQRTWSKPYNTLLNWIGKL